MQGRYQQGITHAQSHFNYMDIERFTARYVAAFDELNLLTSASYMSVAGKDDTEKVKQIADDFLSFLIRAYQMGVQSASEMLAFDLEVDVQRMEEAIYEVIDGKTFEDRIADHVASGSLDMLENLAQSEFHRVFNEGIYDGGMDYKANVGYGVTKVWLTVKDDKVRETHQYLESMEVDIDEDFFTFDGDHAPYPGHFAKAANNANCRCTYILKDDGIQDF